MIPRYTPDDFAQLWSPMRKYRAWLDVELAACEAMEAEGLVPKGTADAIAPVGVQIEPSRIDEIEQETHHDVIAFLTHVEELAGPSARFLHRGMTSSDVLDTALAILLREAAERLLSRMNKVLEVMAKRIDEHRTTPMIGRTHGISAQPITFGLALSGHYAELDRARERLRKAKAEISVGKLSGAVGTYGHLTPEIERRALDKLHLTPETVATQVVCRDRHASYMSALALGAAAIERLATNMRHWQRSEVAEAEEAFSQKQKGSSAMPHKRNPISSENLCGLSRIVRGAIVPALENISLWHERDISHSSVERMILPDATTTLAYMLDRTRKLVEHLVVKKENLLENIESTGELWASEGILLELVEAGMPRQEAYVLVQRNAMKALETSDAFRALLLKDADIRKHLGEETIEKHFKMDYVLSHVNTIIDRALKPAESKDA